MAIETDKNLIVMALSGAGFTVYPINPRAVARYRERHGRAGGKSDPGDAAILANVLRTDKHMHRPLPAVSEHGSTVKMLAPGGELGPEPRPSAGSARSCWSSTLKH